jgi:hypothetical protein
MSASVELQNPVLVRSSDQMEEQQVRIDEEAVPLVLMNELKHFGH